MLIMVGALSSGTCTMYMCLCRYGPEYDVHIVPQNKPPSVDSITC